MPRVAAVEPTQVTGRGRVLLGEAEQLLGGLPGVARTLAHSPAALESFLGLMRGMGHASIGAKLHAQILLAVSEANRCDYCVSLLTSAIAPASGVAAPDILASRRGQSPDAKTQAALTFAKAVLDSRGSVGDEDLAAVRAAGYSEAAVVEIVSSVALGCFTNFINNVAETALDYAKAEPVAA